MLITAALAASVGTTAKAASPQSKYTITDLGPSTGEFLGAVPVGPAINTSGDVAISTPSPSGDVHAVIYKAGVRKDLGILPGATDIYATGINGYDEVTGYAQFPNATASGGSVTHAFLYKDGALKDLGTLPGDSSSSGAGINDSGEITGTSGDQGFLYSGGKMRNLVAPSAGVTSSNGVGINAAGQVAGTAIMKDGEGPHAAIFTNGSVTELNLGIAPGLPTHALALNDLDQLTGFFYRSDDYISAFLSTEDTRVATGTPPGQYSQGSSINAAGTFVGSAYNTGNRFDSAFLYTSGQGYVNLNTLLPGGSGWTITDAAAINDKGQITGVGLNPQGVSHSFVLSPVFAPFKELRTSVEILDGKHPTFVASGELKLGRTSNSIDPLTETVVLQLGGYHIAIPPSSFVKSHGAYTYQGKIGAVEVEALIWPASTNVYLFAMTGRGAVGLPRGCPEAVTLTIGDDTGTDRIKDRYGDAFGGQAR